MPINLQQWRQRQYMTHLLMIYSACLPILLLLYAVHSMVMNNITFKIDQLTQHQQALNHHITAIQSNYNLHHCDTYLLLQQNEIPMTKYISLQKTIRQLLTDLPSLTPAGCQINQLIINDQQIEWQLHALRTEDIAHYRQRIQPLPFINDITVSRLQQSPNGLDQYQATVIARLSSNQPT